jgi:hypothetical protein
MLVAQSGTLDLFGQVQSQVGLLSLFSALEVGAEDEGRTLSHSIKSLLVTTSRGGLEVL